MAIQGKFLKICNLFNSYRNVLGNTTNRCAFPCYQQVAYLKKEQLEEWKNLPKPPKKPLTPYFKYMTQLRPELTKDKKIKLTDFVKEVSLRWEKEDPQIKHKMEEEYKREQELYTKQKLDFETQLTDKERMAIKEAKIARAEDRQKRRYRKKCREFNKPKKPASAYVLYLKKELPNRGSKNFRQWQSETAKKWNELPDEQKKPYLDETKDAYKEYQLKMAAWEREMIKLGNLDIVRQDALIEPKPKGKKTKKSEE